MATLQQLRNKRGPSRGRGEGGVGLEAKDIKGTLKGVEKEVASGKGEQKGEQQ